MCITAGRLLPRSARYGLHGCCASLPRLRRLFQAAEGKDGGGNNAGYPIRAHGVFLRRLFARNRLRSKSSFRRLLENLTGLCWFVQSATNRLPKVQFYLHPRGAIGSIALSVMNIKPGGNVTWRNRAIWGLSLIIGGQLTSLLRTTSLATSSSPAQPPTWVEAGRSPEKIAIGPTVRPRYVPGV